MLSETEEMKTKQEGEHLQNREGTTVDLERTEEEDHKQNSMGHMDLLEATMENITINKEDMMIEKKDQEVTVIRGEITHKEEDKTIKDQGHLKGATTKEKEAQAMEETDHLVDIDKEVEKEDKTINKDQ